MANTLHTPGLVLTEHEFSVPLDHDRPDGEHITVFAREVADLDGRERPFLVFFQGGPGYEATRPTRHPDAPSWLDRALQDFRVLMLDQRGTGRSTPVGTLRELAPDERAAYLSHFRADSIVRDAEWIRGELGVDSWSILGQSFGGFCVTTYLSFAPEGLREAFITGGLPPMGHHIDEVYRATYQRALERNHRYFERYPGDREHVRAIHQRLESHDVRLPSGDRLTSRRLRQLGMLLGMSDGFEQLHYILELPFASPGFLHDVEAAVNFARNPLYAVLHEACYGDGYATQWSADRMLPSEYKASDLFTGEHIYPWLFEDCAALAPLRKGAEILAAHTWPPLYDGEQLRRNEVPTAAVIYAEDMYVERSFSEETAHRIRNLRAWVTNEYQHNGLRTDGGRILGRLIQLARGRI